MSYEEKLPELEFSKEELIHKCIYGDTYSEDRNNACMQLKDSCLLKMNKLSNIEQQEIRDNIMNEAGIESVPDLENKVYLDKHGRPIAEHELEGYYINLSPDPQTFTNIVYAEEAYKYPEEQLKYIPPRKISAEVIKYYSTKKHFDDKYIQEKTKDPFGECYLSLLGIETQFNEQIGDGLFQTANNARDVIHIEEEILYPEVEIDVYETCNNILNPKFPPEEYQICSETTNHNEQHWVLKKKDIIKKAIQADTWEQVRGLDMELVWDVIKPEDKVSVHRSALGETRNVENVWYRYIETERNKIIDYIKDNLTPQQRADMVESRDELYGYKEISRQDCVTNVFAMTNYPDILRTRWLDIQLAYENGEISEDKALKLIEDLKNYGDVKKTVFREGEAPPGFTKPTEYIPSRLRLNSAQYYMNSLFNNALIDNSINDIVKNSYEYNFITNNLTAEINDQLKNNYIKNKDTLKLL